MNLENMIQNNPQALVKSVNGVMVADSLQVADSFGKRHSHVLRAIENLITSLSAEEAAVNDEEWMYEKVIGSTQPQIGLSEKYFIPSTYKDSTGRELSHYWLTRDGFSLLVMGFTGPAALHWKLLYIEAFNKMEQALRSNVDIRQLVTQITTDVLRTVLPDIRQAVEPPPEIEDGRVHNSRRLDFLYGNDEALPNFLTVYDIRDYLGIGQRQAYELVKSEGFPTKKLGNSYRIPKEDFLEWVRKQ
ncbi:Rha family transcriptional regulator [Blautia wexlerae]|uniref:Rha family transcriptional regulator n=1 Tax=Blautia wexlerae TaxID=418240 RepID=UPI00232D21C0|nr:Rha family transcriptional regulator [Blautia wexlerae]MDB6435672.1 Rha family transcriptional regulator [Blautia wexlerae]